MINLEESFITYLHENREYPVENDFNAYQMGKNILVVEIWNFDYLAALRFQKLAQDYVSWNRDKRIYIFTSHPRVFTVGRGLVKGKSTTGTELREFNESLVSRLKFPVHRIKRGGGITFHYPGQWIFYPIVNLNHPDNNLKDLIHFMLDSAKKVVSDRYGLTEIDTRRKQIGMWKGNYKLASLGIGLEKFVTYHGMALNVSYDELMWKELGKINPCGFPSSTYRCLEDFIGGEKKDIMLEFHEYFIYHMRKTVFV